MTVAFADDVRENGGAVLVRFEVMKRTIYSPIARIGVPGTLPSFLGTGVSRREDKADVTRGP